MYIVDLLEKNAYGLPANQYCMDDLNAFESGARREVNSIWKSNLTVGKFCAEKDWNDRKVLFILGGGLGDILFSTPVIREMKKRWPKVHITFACFPRFHAALEGNPDVDVIMAYPFPVADFGQFAAHITLEDYIDNEKPESRKKHAVDIILDTVGLTCEDKELRLELGYLEREKAVLYMMKARPRIGIQLSASAPVRSWPKKHVVEFSQKAVAAGFEIIWFGLPGESKLPQDSRPQWLYDLTSCQPELTLRESIAMISTCDLFIGPDSGLTHCAGALGVPTLALYGPFASRLRTAYASSIKAIDAQPYGALRGKQPCNPCYYSVRPGKTMFPENGPCAEVGKCVVMESITPDEVLKKAKRFLRKRGERGTEDAELVET